MKEKYGFWYFVGDYNFRKIYYPALEQLERYNITPQRENDLSTHIDELDLDEYDKIICMDEPEHRPMVEQNMNLKLYYHLDAPSRYPSWN